MISLRIRQIHFKVSQHQKFGTKGSLLERGDNTLYHQGVVRGEVTSDDVPPMLPRRQLEANNVGHELLDGLHCETRCRTIEDCDPAAVSARRICSDGAAPGRPAVVDAIGDFRFLEDTQLHIGLGHLPQRLL